MDVRNVFEETLKEFKGSKYFKEGTFDSDCTVDEVYQHAVRLAYKDLQWRTIKNHKNDNKETNIIEIAKIFRENVENNDTHISLIRKAAEVFERDFGNIAKDQCFGKAQKVINMALKYLYCINSPSVKIEYKCRDIALDDRILDFYYSLKSKRKINKAERVYSWSNISEDDYCKIQYDLKEYINEMGFDLAPVEAEFIIWNYATVKLIIDTYEKAKKQYEMLEKELKNSNECYKIVSDLLK